MKNQIYNYLTGVQIDQILGAREASSLSADGSSMELSSENALRQKLQQTQPSLKLEYGTFLY